MNWSKMTTIKRNKNGQNIILYGPSAYSIFICFYIFMDPASTYLQVGFLLRYGPNINASQNFCKLLPDHRRYERNKHFRIFSLSLRGEDISLSLSEAKTILSFFRKMSHTCYSKYSFTKKTLNGKMEKQKLINALTRTDKNNNILQNSTYHCMAELQF